MDKIVITKNVDWCIESLAFFDVNNISHRFCQKEHFGTFDCSVQTTLAVPKRKLRQNEAEVGKAQV